MSRQVNINGIDASISSFPAMMAARGVAPDQYEDFAVDLISSFQITNQAEELYDTDPAESERLTRVALEQKLNTIGENHVSTAISYNSLGRAIKAQGRFEEAIPYLKKALQIRKRMGGGEPGCFKDVAVSRDELGVCYQGCGMPEKAREVRLEGGQEAVICTNESCSKTAEEKGLGSLRLCSQCNCTWYCSISCQKTDWKRVHKKICKPWTPSEEARTE
jgi:tetratricopeptide (TPR) repeat protein